MHSIHAKDQVQWGAEFGGASSSCQKSTYLGIFKSKKREEWTIFESTFVGLALVGKDTVLRFIIEYSSVRDFGP